MLESTVIANGISVFQFFSFSVFRLELFHSDNCNVGYSKSC
ncbi:hypothetical protein VCSRO77_2448 [Vibrio cholerae]|nr:hypothetical protein VCSRO77_2448 [Vibrio cholerae]